MLAMTYPMQDGVGNALEAENTKDDTTFGEKPKTGSDSPVKVESLHQPKTSPRAQEKGIEVGNVAERVQIVQQAIRELRRVGALNGVLVSQKTIKKEQKVGIAIMIEGCSICHKCRNWNVGERCQNPMCEEFANNIVGEVLEPFTDDIEKPKSDIEKPKAKGQDNAEIGIESSAKFMAHDGGAISTQDNTTNKEDK